MVVARSLRRTNPITIVLAGLLTIGFLFFLISPTSSAAATSDERHRFAAQNPLSPPTKPFRKDKASRNAPPPVVRYAMNNMTITSSPAQNRERVLILTPLSRFYKGYWDNLVKLTYPHQYISLGFIIPKTKEGNAATSALQHAISTTQSGPIDDRFASISILRQDFAPPLDSQSEKERHKLQNQKVRRESMSRARNSLLFTTLGPSTSWVLWLDGDIVETPHSLIEDLTSHDKPIIVANCFQRYRNPDTRKMDVRPYDYNSWMETARSTQIAAGMDRDDLMLEGYSELPTYRTLMARLADTSFTRNVREIIPLDGVGGTALMVKGDVHRDGAMFPPFSFYHLVETEGFAKMASRLGWKSFGLPNYFVSFFSLSPSSETFMAGIFFFFFQK